MGIWMIAICVVGVAVDVCFIRAEYAEQMARATLLKGLASLCFVVLGVLCLMAHPSGFGRLVVAGLVLGMVGDVLLNLRNLYEGATSRKVFALGILAFLSGHVLYIVALARLSVAILPWVLVLTAVLAALSIPPLMRRIEAPSPALKAFGWVYLCIVIAMFSCAAVLLATAGASLLTVLFALGGLLFVVSDFIMIYYSFGKKIKPLRAINLLSYYAAQLLIALCILGA